MAVLSGGEVSVEESGGDGDKGGLGGSLEVTGWGAMG